jgi:hypothetical protein
MKRRGKPLEVSTFPFLAVLLCAMGSLILVLIVMDRKAKMAARAKAMAAQAQAAEQLAKVAGANQRQADAAVAREKVREDLHAALMREQQQVQAQLKEVQNRLGEAALRLKAELDATDELKQRGESNRSRLAAEEEALTATRRAIDELETQTAAESAAKAKMAAELAQLESTLKDLKAARERDRQTYSVVPYHGKHGESRQPLYIECTRNGIVLHPDRVEMALGPNSAAARAEILRRLQHQKEFGDATPSRSDERPYLLLLVRPDGITSYYELQSAVRDLDVQFGYEFVDSAWVFDFPSEQKPPPAHSPAPGARPNVIPVPTGAAIAMLPPEKVRANESGREGSGAPNVAGTSMAASGPADKAAAVSVPAPIEAWPTNVGAARSVSPANDQHGTHGKSADTDFATAGHHPGQSQGTGGSPASGFASTTIPSIGNNSGTTTGPAPEGAKQASPSALVPGPTLPPGVMGSAHSGEPQGGQSPDSDRPRNQKTPDPAGNNGEPTRGTGPAKRPTDDAPRFAPPQTAAAAKKPPAPLRVARLSGDRDYVIFIECRPEDVVLYPSQQSFSVQQLARGDQAIVQAVKQMVERKQALVRPGELPFRPQVRFLVRPESIRSYHTAYPTLNALGIPQTRQNLQVDDDVAAIVVGQ